MSMTRNIMNTAIFQLHHFQLLYSYHSLSSSSSSDIENQLPKPLKSLDRSPNEFQVEVLHAKLIKNASLQHLPVSNYLLNLYAKSHDLLHAHKAFDEIPRRDIRSWTILMSGLSRIGSYRMALELFTKMQKQGITPNHFALSTVFKSCSGANALRMGKAIHGWIICNGIALDITLENSILDFYVKCGAFPYARTFFELMIDKDTVSSNIMISAYLQIGDVENSRDLFSGLPVKDVASWNTIIDGHLQNGSKNIAMDLLYQMVKVGPSFSKVTFSIALVLVSSFTNLKLGRQIHGRVLRTGIHDGFVRNSLIDMYCKCGQMEKASILFRNLPRAIVGTQYSEVSSDKSMAESVSCSSMVTGYVQNGRLDDAIRFFSTMVREGIKLDEFTLTSIISACANAGILMLGQLIHAYILKTGHESDVFLGSVMIDMYAKCGRLYDAWLIFRQTNVRNIVLWSSMISSYASHGQAREAIWLFECMRNEDLTPNEVSFVGVLTACSHAGLINEGCNYFLLMKEVYGIKPQIEHYTCMVDLFGRAGHLDEIKDFIDKNDISHLGAVWRAFLSSCRVHRNIEMARWVSDKLLELEPFTPGPYILLSNTCASDHNWDEAAKLRVLMQERGITKHPAQSWIQLKN